MELFIGVDVSKDTLDVHCNSSHICVLNDQKGLIKLHKLLNKEISNGNKIALIVCEPTGGYEKKLVDFMLTNHLPIHRAHANKVRKFAESKGLFAKTDKIDAYVLSEYGQTMKPEADEKSRTVEEDALAELLRRREQLIKDSVREESRLDKNLSSSSVKSIKAHIKWLDKEKAKIEKEANELKKNEQIKQKIKLLESVPSIGEVTAATLVAFLPELGKSDEKELAALVGLAPFAKESGKYRGKRTIKGGRAIVRRALYMAALTASRFYKEMKDFYLRLLSKGKLKKVALTAVARKLLHVANSVMKRQTGWKTQLSEVAC